VPTPFQHGVGADAAGHVLNARHTVIATLSDDVGGAEVAGQLLPWLVAAHGDDPLGAQPGGGQHTEQADCTIADNCDGHTGLHVRGDGGEPAGAHHVRRGQQARNELLGGRLGRGHQGAVG